MPGHVWTNFQPVGEGPSISKPVLTLTSAAETFDKDVIGENKTGGIILLVCL